MQPSSSASEWNNMQCNILYLKEGERFPPLPVDGHWTYPMQTNFEDIKNDCLQVGCGPMQISAVSLWLRELRDSTVDVLGADPRDINSDPAVEDSAVAAVLEPDPDPLNPTMPEEEICRLDHQLRFVLEKLESGFRSLHHPKPFEAAKSLAATRLNLMEAGDMEKVKRQRLGHLT